MSNLQEVESYFHLEEDIAQCLFSNNKENQDFREASCFTLVKEDDTVFLEKSHSSFQNPNIGAALFSSAVSRSETFLWDNHPTISCCH